MKVSVITPTYGRSDAYLKNLYEAFRNQTHTEKELLVLDDSPTPSEFFRTLSDADVTYLHQPERITVGAKRNDLIQRATGDVIVHFDDDDYYAPSYIEKSLTALGDADFVTLSGWFAYLQREQSLYYWDTEFVGRCHYKLAPRDELELVYTEHISDQEKQIWVQATQWGFGFSYVYRRRIFNTIAFEEVSLGEDYSLVKALMEAGGHLALWKDEEGLVLHVVHNLNLSLIHPQFLLPNFLLGTIFGSKVSPYITIQS